MQIALHLVGGLILLVLGGELLVRGAVQVAIRFGVSPLVIGLTLVGFGTSMPELVTSVQAALSGSPGIAYGNVVGSNIANILLIMGIAAILTPIVVSSNALRRDSSIMVLVTVVFAGVAALVPMGLLVGVVFVAALVGYVFAAFWQERALAAGALDAAHGAVFDKSLAMQEIDPGLKATSDGDKPPFISILIALAGLALVVLGGNFLVSGAVGLARSFSISETIVGLTIVAVGTSMPELVTSVMAALRKQTEVALGSVIGSNIYNILGIGGFTALISPTTVPREIVRFDNLVMIGASLLLVLFAFTGRRISRVEGAILVAGYAAYVASNWP